MNPAVSLKKLLVGSPVVAATAYAALVIVLLAIAISSLGDMLGQRASVSAATAML
ncbi:MAG: hypothetical protein WBW45_02500 [Bradyrhizobium sp.]